MGWIKYPGGSGGQAGEQVYFTYQPQNLINTVIGSTTYIKGSTYDAAGRLDLRELGLSGSNALLQIAYTYFAWTSQGGRLQRLNAGTYASQASLLDQRYTYDSVGNITSLLDVSNSSQKQCFGYDALERLTSAKAGNNDSTCSGAVGNGEYADESYTYDATTGNLASKTGMGTYTYDATHKHAVASTSAGWAYQYDANGNMTRRDPPGTDYYDFVYDAENQLTQAKKNGAVTATFTYDGDGRRVKSVIGSATTVFVGGYYEVSGSAVTKYYLAGSQRLAMRTSSGLTFLFGDQLGSTSVTHRLNDGQIMRQLYRPWGEVRYSSSSLPTRYQYTGQYTYAADFGLYFYNARWYDSQLGRFNQADTLVPNTGDPQAWDRYAAMNNNPVRFTDPTGHFEFEEGPNDPYFAPASPGINPARRYRTVGVTQSEADKIFSRWIRNPLPEGDPGPHNFGDNRGAREIPDQWNGKTQYHASMDAGHEFDQEVYPLAPGKVVFTGWTGMGNTVVIEHNIYGIKLYSVYGHFGENGNAEIYISPGVTVSYNDVIGLTGNSKPDCANCSPHLHFEVRYPANINLGNPNDVLSGMRYWAFEGEDWHLYFYDLGQIWGFDPDKFGNP